MCTIEITSVTATGSGTPTAITVSGTADLCTLVQVRIDCSGGVATQTVPVSGGTWTAVFDAATGLPAQCTCQANIRVSARCVDDPTGANVCTDDFSGVVDCEAVCPDVLVNASVAPDCNTDGTRTVTLNSVQFSGSAPVAQWDLGVPFVLTPNVIHSEAHHYAPGAHTAILTITGCPPVTLPFDVPTCPCPDLQVSASPDEEHCSNGLMDVALTVSTSFTATLSCTWDFGDGTSAGFTLVGPGTDTRHHAYAPGPHTATLSVVGCPTETVSFVVPSCPTGDDDDDDGGGGGGGLLCGLLCAIWILLLAGYLVGIATGALANPILLGLATAALVAYSGIYIKICGICQYAKCTLAGLGLFLLALLLMLLLSVPLPGLTAALITAGGFLLAALVILALGC